METQAYLIRYGLMGHVSRFRVSPECDGVLGRGQAVVIRTDRGVELGEVLLPVDGTAPVLPADRQRVVRTAGPEDLARSRQAEAIRPDRFALCQRILREGDWPWELVDVEPMLDDGATVLHYLGPHQVDATTLRARFRMTCDFDVVLEPVGADAELAEEDLHSSDDHGGGCGSCGSGSGGGCGSCGSGSGGGCGSCGSGGGATPRSDDASAGPAKMSHSGCDSCGISRLMAERGRRPRPVGGTT